MTFMVTCKSAHNGKWSKNTTVAPTALTPVKAGYLSLPIFIVESTLMRLDRSSQEPSTPKHGMCPICVVLLPVVQLLSAQ
jgi:hypothetical protein